MDDIYQVIRAVAKKYATEMHEKLKAREHEMQHDDTSHFLIYSVLGVPVEEGLRVDWYQNFGRFLYKYAGSLLEEATLSCFKWKYADAQKIRIPNSLGTHPKNFEIDCLIGDRAHEIKCGMRQRTEIISPKNTPAFKQSVPADIYPYG